MDLLSTILIGIIVASTPLVFAAVGELVVEKSGVLNLGVEGMMIIGAFCGFAATLGSGNPYVGMLAAMLAGATLSMVFAFFTQTMLANQVATGLALTLFGLGLAALLGQNYSGISTPSLERLHIPFLSDIPLIGTVLLGLDPLAYFSFILVGAVAWFLHKTRAGLILRAIGENHEAARLIGYPVIPYRTLAIAFGGACAGLGGAYLSIVQTPFWVENMTAGRGWIALALVVFATWKPWRAVAGAYIFGGTVVLQLHGQGFGVKIEPQILAMLPYLATIAVLVMISRNRYRLNAPACLGVAFYPDR